VNDLSIVMFPEPERINDPLIDFIMATKEAMPGSKLGVNKDGWNSPKVGTVWDVSRKEWVKVGQWPEECPVLRELERFIISLLEPAGNWVVATWVNVVPLKARVTVHDHSAPGNEQAAVYHICGRGDLNFPTIGQSLTPVPGQVVIFPALLAHEVEYVFEGPERLSVSMNFGRIIG